jgi:hypothetical protein
VLRGPPVGRHDHGPLSGPVGVGAGGADVAAAAAGRFPRGVADPGAGRGFVHDPSRNPTRALPGPAGRRSSRAPAWQRVDGAGPRPLRAQRYCTCITIDPADPDVVYVAFGGYVNGNI